MQSAFGVDHGISKAAAMSEGHEALARIMAFDKKTVVRDPKKGLPQLRGRFGHTEADQHWDRVARAEGGKQIDGAVAGRDMIAGRGQWRSPREARLKAARQAFGDHQSLDRQTGRMLTGRKNQRKGPDLR